MQWVLEVNGAFGPYSKCNPDVVNGKFICGVWNWNSTTRLSSAPVCVLLQSLACCGMGKP